MSIYRRTLSYCAPFTRQTLIALSLSLAAIGFNLLKPWPIKLLIDGVLAPSTDKTGSQDLLLRWFPDASTHQVVLWLCLSIVVLYGLWGALNLGANYLFLKVGLRAVLKLRTDLYVYLQSLPLRFHDHTPSADSSFRVAYDSQSVQTIYHRGLSDTTNSLVTLVGVFSIMLVMNWQLALTALAIVPFIALTVRLFAQRIRKQSTSIQEHESAVLNKAQETLQSMRLVHTFGQENNEVDQFRQRAELSREANLRFNLTSLQSSLIAGVLIAIGTAAMYFIGAGQVLNGSLTIGDLVVFAAYLAMLYAPIESLAYTAWAMEAAAAGATRCFEIFDTSNDIPDKPDAHPLSSCEGHITFSEVRFRYKDSPDILTDLSFDIPAGSRTAIIGPSGCGKSTLLSLIPRLYEATAGSVLVDGHEVRDLTRQSLRSHISVVLQDSVLFSTSVLENIAYGSPGANKEDIITAAKNACAHDFIVELPDGYDTQVGERGSLLSAGQRQRIGIARAFLCDSRILLMDEPTSDLDSQTEDALFEILNRLMAGRTTLIVTHRLDSIHNADQIIVLDQGRIVESGTGPELLAKEGTYAQLYRS